MDLDQPVRRAFLFFSITLGLSWFIFWGPLAVFQVPAISFVTGKTGPWWAITLFITGGFVPSLTALVLTAATEGRAGLRGMGRRLIRFNIGWRWYLAAVVVTMAGALGQIAIIFLLGQTFDWSLFITQLGSFIPLIILGPLSEELGWRGYALPRLQTRWNALAASLIVGVFWALWHLPLFLMPGTSQHELNIPFAGFLVGLTAVSVIFTWLNNNTGSSLWTAVFFHWIYTYSAQVVSSGVTRSPLYNAFEFLPYILLAVVVVIIWKPRTFSRHSVDLTIS